MKKGMRLIVNRWIWKLLGAGFTQPRTMKLNWELHEQEVMILIDGGAIHNFGSRKLIKRLDLEVLINTTLL